MGAATADVLYGAMAGFGLTFISTALLQYQHWIQFLGGLCLLYFAIKILGFKPVVESGLQGRTPNLWWTYLGSFFLNLTNPMTLLLFLSIFSGLGLLNTNIGHEQTGLLMLGILLGACFWWLILCTGITFLLSERIRQKALIWVQRSAGFALLLFAGALLLGYSL